jgi:hypothetical protein
MIATWEDYTGEIPTEKDFPGFIWMGVIGSYRKSPEKKSRVFKSWSSSSVGQR